MKSAEWKFGMSSCCTGAVTREVFEAYAANHVDVMEVSIGYEGSMALDWKALRKNADETGVGLWSFHLPYCPFEFIDPASPDPAIRKKTLELQTEFIRHCGDIGIGIAVIHPSAEPNPDEDRPDRLRYAQETLSLMTDNAAKEGVILAVEDLPRSCIGHTTEEIAFILKGNDKMRVCFDTNHLLYEDNADFVRGVGDKIVTLHVSDYDFDNEKHWLPYEGKNNWIQLVTLLEEAGYQGPFMYEVGFGKPRMLNRRELTFADVRENYLALVNKEVAKRIPFTPYVQEK